MDNLNELVDHLTILREHLRDNRTLNTVMVPASTVEYLVEHVGAEIEEARQVLAIEARSARASVIVRLLFPSYGKVAVRDGRAVKPPIHPACAWWWNGASIDLNSLELRGPGEDVSCTVESYVGSGETDRFSLTIPAAWMDAPAGQLQTLVHTWIAEETQRLAVAEKMAQLRKAEADAKAAVDRLAKLQGGA